MDNQQKTGLAIHISGIVQGVGFRPFVYRIATELGIFGTVRNDGQGVEIEAFAPPEVLDHFLRQLRDSAPPLSRIEQIYQETMTAKSPTGMRKENSFRILLSGETKGAQAAIPSDIALCQRCAAEITDPDNRRYNYPFTNCTDCGPRYTIVSEVPYDRSLTSMRDFKMCKECQREYDDPANRRFHAQPNACPVCGPQLTADNGESPLPSAVAALAAGKIVAIRALGGYQLVVDACNEDAVTRLRQRKKRPDKPLAIMIQAEESLWDIALPDPQETALLKSPQAPIILLKKKPSSQLAANIAPAIGEIGIMLPSTPLHKLLFATPGCPPFLVMTSGNIHGNPICRTPEEAGKELLEVADIFLHHNRDILTRVDDSVIRVAGEKSLLIRRSRGFAPNSLRIAQKLPPLIACGGAMKNTFCLARGNELIVSQHIGDLENPATFDFFLETFAHLKKLYHIEPELVVCDRHPDYPSSRFAKELDLPLYQVQHHHAHAAAVMAEHHLHEALAIVLDGTGLGDDGTIWGGEILHIAPYTSTRLAHLTPIPLPGGDQAAMEPWRMAMAVLHTCGIDDLPPTLERIAQPQRHAIQALLSSKFHCPQTSSAGRLFDAAASLLGIRQQISYEGQAAMELEYFASRAFPEKQNKQLSHTFSKTEHAHFFQGKWEINTKQFVTMLLDGLAQGESTTTLALRFHQLLISAFATTTLKLAQEHGIRNVVLSGGCMQNRILLEGFLYFFQKSTVQIFLGEALPMNDGGLAAGQAIIGGMAHVSGNSNESNRH